MKALILSLPKISLLAISRLSDKLINDELITIDKQWTYYTFTKLTLTVNITMTSNAERRCSGIDRMWISGSEFKRFTDICNIIRWIKNRVRRFTNSINITTTLTGRITMYRTITDIFTVTYSNRRDRRWTCMWWTRCCTSKRFMW